MLSGISVLAGNKDKKKLIETTFTVEGVCKMCEKRIENAALIKGVKMADWDLETHQLKVVFQPEKVNELAIHKAIANMGHDTDKVKAPDEVYDKIHYCCQYRDQEHDHHDHNHEGHKH